MGIGKSWPSASTLKIILCDGAVDVILRIRELIATNGGAPVFIQCDKGHRKGVNYFVKLIVFWDSIKQKVRVFCLDIDRSEGTSEVPAKAIFHSVITKLGDDIKLSGQTADIGGNGIGESLMEELRKLFLISVDHFEFYFCSLHGVQLTFANPIKTLYGEGKIGKRNAL